MTYVCTVNTRLIFVRIVNRKFSFPNTVEMATALYAEYGGMGIRYTSGRRGNV